MTEDETNVDSSLPTINHESQSPDASNTGKVAKQPLNIALVEYGLCCCFDENSCHYHNELDGLHTQLSQLQERNGEHVADTKKRQEIAVGLNMTIADLEKRNKEWIEDRDRWIERYKKLQGELKTAEDKLAAALKRCAEIWLEKERP